VRPTVGLYSPVRTCSSWETSSPWIIVCPYRCAPPAQLSLAVHKWRHPKGDSSRNKGAATWCWPHCNNLDAHVASKLKPAIILEPRGDAVSSTRGEFPVGMRVRLIVRSQNWSVISQQRRISSHTPKVQ
jgi:hypothetical protein